MPTGIAIVLVDPYNDFLHPEGKANKLIRNSLEATNAVAHLRELVQGARAASIPIFYALHQQYQDGNYDHWKHMNKSLKGIETYRMFEQGSFGAQIYECLEPQPSNGDVIVSKHWNSSSFANTDLDYQLRQRDVSHLVLAGMVANTCVEATARYAQELGYHVTLLTDATAGFTVEATDAATKLIWPLIAEEVTTVGTWLAKLNSGHL